MLAFPGVLVALLWCGYAGAVMNSSFAPYVCDTAQQLRTTSDFRVHLWAMAQREIGLKPDLAKLRDAVFIETFYGGYDFGFSAYIIDNKPIHYTRIWKNANSGIRNSFFIYLRSKNKDNFCPGGGSKCTPSDFDHPENDYEAVANKYTAQTNHSMQAFSFIRRPMSHFISGLKEYYWLRNLRMQKPEDKKEKVSVNDLALFLRSFLDVANPAPEGVFTPPLLGHLNTIQHVYPQSTNFRERYGKHLIGRMENFQEDWRRIQDAFGIDVPIRKEYGERESSKDTAEVGASWNKLLAQRPQFLRALCWLLLPDFLCFNYQLPAQCEDIPYHLRFAYPQLKS